MRLNEQEYLFCEKHIDLIKKIVRTASAAYIEPDYREGLIEIGNKYKIMNCNVCNSSLYLGTCRLFYMYEDDRVEKERLLKELQNAPKDAEMTRDDAKDLSNINNNTTKKECARASSRKRNTDKK